MFTLTAGKILPCTVTGSWPRPRWFDMSMWGRPLDTCLMDTRFREKFQDALAVVLSDQERAGLDILTHGDLHCDDDMAGRSWHHYPLQRWAGFDGDYLQSDKTRSPWLRYPPGTLLNEIYTGWRWPRVVDKITHRPLDYPKIWRMAQAKTSRPVRFGTCCSQVMGLFLDIHTPKYKDTEEVIWDMAVAMNKELLALRDAGCKCIQIEEPTLHFWANSYGASHEKVQFMLKACNRELEGLDDVEVWIHTCWGNPNMQRVIENDSYRESFQLYLEACRGDVWTVEMKDRNMREIELFAPLKGKLKKKICVGVVSHRRLQVEQAEEVASSVRHALKHIAPEQLIISSDCGFGRQGCNRDIAFFKTAALVQGTNIVKRELGVPESPSRAADPALQTDIVPAEPDR
ncbi:Methionine synthase (B12-independent) [Verrucomicrobia bacterium]|nr:Methionine synthase (B12-independent) [Verrucomicrobiota bacterium]